MMKERFQKLNGENFQRTEAKFCEENDVYKATKNTDKTGENKNSKFPVILIDEEESIFIEVESN